VPCDPISRNPRSRAALGFFELHTEILLSLSELQVRVRVKIMGSIITRTG
jgi:hypothetical protein